MTAQIDMAEWKRNLPKIMRGEDPLAPNDGAYCERCAVTFRTDEPKAFLERYGCSICGHGMVSMSRDGIVMVWKL